MMDYSEILSVNYREECKLVELNGNTSFEDVVSQILGTWEELSLENLTMRLSVGSIKNCCLVSNSDLKNMLLICNHTSEKNS